MNRLREKTTATLLIAIFMISAFAVVAIASPGYFLESHNSGTAEWSTSVPYAVGRGIKLQVPIYDPVEYAAQIYDWACVVFSYSGDLDSLLGVSYNSYVDSGMNGKYHPFVVLYVDTDNNNDVDAWVVQLEYPPFGLDTWGLTTFEDDTIVHVAGTQPASPPPKGGAWTQQDPATALANEQDLGSLKLQWGTFTVLKISIETGVQPITEAITSYVDDVTINDILYDFESETSTSIESRGRYPLLGIQVDPTSVDFGMIVAGHSSGTETVTVTNIGEETITVTAKFENEDPSSFYTDNLKLDGYSIADWNLKTTAHTIVVDADLPVGLVLSVPSAGPVGVYTGTLVFEITPPPP